MEDISIYDTPCTRVILSFGSNVEDGEYYIVSALEMFKTVCRLLEVSEIYYTPSIHSESDTESHDYANCVVIGETRLPVSDIFNWVKDYEVASGRTVEARKAGQVTIDIDLMQYGTKKFHLKDWTRDYFLRGLNSLNPSLLKSVNDTPDSTSPSAILERTE